MAVGFQINKDTQEAFKKIEALTEQFIRDRIEVDTHFFFHSDLLKPILKDSGVLSELKSIITKSVISKKGDSSCAKEIKEFLLCINLYKDEMHWDIKDLAFNFYQVHDAIYTRLLGASFGFRYFVYQGGTLEDSRDFCVAHNDKVWSVEEAEEWAKWTPDKGEYPAGYQIKQIDANAIPSYLGYPGYIPLVDRGGFNCRHFIGWIPESMAFEKRPDLMKK
jgi:hypothetical protein